MAYDSQYAQRQGITVTKSALAVDDETRVVSLSFATDRPEAVTVRVADQVPSTHTLRWTDANGATVAFSDGHLAVERVIQPGETAQTSYLLTGPVGATLPDPTLDGVGAVADGDLVADPTVEWIASDGATTALDAVRQATQTTGSDSHSDSDSGTEADDAQLSLDGVAVGVVLTLSNADAVFRTVLRASRRGHPVLATYSGVSGSDEALATLASLGTLVVAPPSKRDPQATLNRLLSRRAREQGLPGIVLQTRECPRIDYDRTAQAFEQADYEVVAIPEEWSHPDIGSAVVVGIPAYNAADSIAEVVDRAAAFADEVVVVDDGSRDETAARAREAGATVVVHDRNRGYGGALKTAFREADARDAAHLVVIDADGQHDPADIPMLVETQTNDDADIVIGSRYVGDRRTKIPFVRSLGLAVINNLTNVSLGNLRPSGFVRDTQSGYRAYNRRAIRSLAADPTIGNNMGASTDILYHAHRNRLSVAEVATTISYDVENASSQGSVSHGIDLVRNIVWTIEYGRPLIIIGMPGAITTLMGVSVALFLLVQFVETGMLAPVQLGIAIMFAIGGLLLCITALTMSVLNGHPTMKRLAGGGND